jgi:cysteine-rich repeat protein
MKQFAVALSLVLAAACGSTVTIRHEDGSGGSTPTVGVTSGGFCGNGIVEGSEQCDDGNGNDDDGCRTDCTATPKKPMCGNGLVEGAEQCDDGNSNDQDDCRNDCTKPLMSAVCGNAKVEGTEECDDGNKVDDDACTNGCKKPKCGDAIVQKGEDCDDGNTKDGDNCPGSCKCLGKIFVGVVSNAEYPKQTGMGFPSKWIHKGLEGVKAGNAACQVIGADHVCRCAR